MKHKDEITLHHGNGMINLRAYGEVYTTIYPREDDARRRAGELRRYHRANTPKRMAVKVFQRTIRADRLVLVLWVVTVRPQEGEEE